MSESRKPNNHLKHRYKITQFLGRKKHCKIAPNEVGGEQ